ncbi:MAG: 4-hydroxy-tetrahydrodipicolinate reductase [Firmicutes bacterium]|nr:4-hydroxy-tetrahydrodipicolinate reductase [Bacillota bacterium]
MKYLIGGKGQMGQKLKNTIEQMGDEVLAMVDALDLTILEGLEKADVIVDFSHADNLEWIADYARENQCPLVYGTTGLSKEQMQKLYDLSKDVPVFYSANYSYGVAVMLKLLKTAVPLLKETFDMELTETHHHRKQDAPSGTAKAMLQIMNEDGSFKEVYGRSGITGPRQREIGVHSLRGGTEAGQHSVYFFGGDESLTITHHATDRQIFVNGAIRAADFIVCKAPGFYTMDDLL